VGDGDAAARDARWESRVLVRTGAEVAGEPGDISTGGVRPEGADSRHKPRVVKQAGVAEARDAEELAPEAVAPGPAKGTPEVSGRAYVAEVSRGLDSINKEASAREAQQEGLAGGAREGGKGGPAGDGEAVQEWGQGARHGGESVGARDEVAASSGTMVSVAVSGRQEATARKNCQ